MTCGLVRGSLPRVVHFLASADRPHHRRIHQNVRPRLASVGNCGRIARSNIHGHGSAGQAASSVDTSGEFGRCTSGFVDHGAVVRGFHPDDGGTEFGVVGIETSPEDFGDARDLRNRCDRMDASYSLIVPDRVEWDMTECLLYRLKTREGILPCR